MSIFCLLLDSTSWEQGTYDNLYQLGKIDTSSVPFHLFPSGYPYLLYLSLHWFSSNMFVYYTLTFPGYNCWEVRWIYTDLSLPSPLRTSWGVYIGVAWMSMELFIILRLEETPWLEWLRVHNYFTLSLRRHTSEKEPWAQALLLRRSTEHTEAVRRLNRPQIYKHSAGQIL